MLRGDKLHFPRFLNYVPESRLPVHKTLLDALSALERIHADGSRSTENAYQVVIEGIDGHVLRVIGRAEQSEGRMDHDLAVNFQDIPSKLVKDFREEWRPYVKNADSMSAPLTCGLTHVGVEKVVTLLNRLADRV